MLLMLKKVLRFTTPVVLQQKFPFANKIIKKKVSALISQSFQTRVTVFQTSMKNAVLIKAENRFFPFK